MSTSVTVRGYFGLPVNRDHFLQVTGTIRECSRNGDSHVVEKRAKFCSECGAELEDVEMLEPTKGFLSLCVALDVRATSSWDELLYDSYVEPWHSGWKTGDKRFGLYPANALNDDSGPRYFVLGYKIGEYASYNYDQKPRLPTISMNEAEMAAFAPLLNKFAELLHISDRPRMYCCAHWG